MPKAVEECVQKLLSQDDFYPGDENRESIAWGICQRQHEAEGSDVHNFSGDGVELIIRASDDGSILYFENAVLCHEGGNANRDFVPVEELDALAGSIGGQAIDMDHDQEVIRGVYTAGRVIDHRGKKALATDGLIWARRFPDDAQEVRAGLYSQSIEAVADNASCSICKTVFAKVGEYCEHIRNRRSTGAYRLLHGLRAVGGALTKSPADADAVFDTSSIYMLASHQESPGRKQEEIDMDGEEMKKRLEELQSELLKKQKDGEAMEKRLTELTASVDTSGAENERLQGEVERLSKELEESKKCVEQLVESSRRAALTSIMDDEEWQKQRGTVMAMTDDQFALLSSIGSTPSKKEKQEKPKPVMDMEGHDSTDDGSGIEWEIR